MFSDCSFQIASLGREDTPGPVILNTVQIDFHVGLLSKYMDFSYL